MRKVESEKWKALHKRTWTIQCSVHDSATVSACMNIYRSTRWWGTWTRLRPSHANHSVHILHVYFSLWLCFRVYVCKVVETDMVNNGGEKTRGENNRKERDREREASQGETEIQRKSERSTGQLCVPGVSLAIVLSGNNVFKQLTPCHPVEQEECWLAPGSLTHASYIHTHTPRTHATAQHHFHGNRTRYDNSNSSSSTTCPGALCSFRIVYDVTKWSNHA